MRGEPTPIQVWECVNYSGFNCFYPKPIKIAYCGENILLFDEKGKRTAHAATQTLLTSPDCISNSKMETIILKYLVEQHQFDHSHFSEKEAKHWRFWKYFDISKLPTINCSPPEIPTYSRKTLTLSSEGIQSDSYDYTSLKSFSCNHFRLDNFFFDGPETPNLTLEDRKKLRQAIFNALAPDAGFSLKDAFVLFDYEKIPAQRWNFDNGYINESVDLSPGYLSYVRSWTDSENVVFSDYSIEKIWAKCPDFVNPMLESAKDFIKKALSNAIITED